MCRPSARRCGAVAVAIAAAATASCASGSLRPVGSARPATTTSTAESGPATPGGENRSDGVGDPLTPGAGNPGIDVEHYAIDLDVTGLGSLDATAALTVRATETRTSFHLDLDGLQVDSVRVDGRDAAFRQVGDELVVTPPRTLESGTRSEVVVAYGGRPEPIDDPSAPGRIGWLTAGPSSFLASEPVGAKSVFPCNDHPSDKATFDIAVTAPEDELVAANGVLTSRTDLGAAVRWQFHHDHPMATYLVQIAIGDYETIEATGPHGLPLRHVVDRRVGADERAELAVTGEQIAYFETLFGPFPFETYGLLVPRSDLGFALETQTLTLMPTAMLDSDLQAPGGVLAHELAHQWFGDDVSVGRWSDIWLNEGFATYAEWLWTDHAGENPLEDRVNLARRTSPMMREMYGAIGSPSAETLFSPNSYDGAALVLHALRLTIGDEAFFTLLRTWVDRYGGTSAGSDDFEALAAEIGGRDLDAFFDGWLRSTSVPDLPE